MTQWSYTCQQHELTGLGWMGWMRNKGGSHRCMTGWGGWGTKAVVTAVCLHGWVGWAGLAVDTACMGGRLTPQMHVRLHVRLHVRPRPTLFRLAKSDSPCVGLFGNHVSAICGLFGNHVPLRAGGGGCTCPEFGFHVRAL